MHKRGGCGFRSGRTELHNSLHQRQRPESAQGHLALGHGGRVQAVHENGTGRRPTTGLRGSFEYAAEKRRFTRG